MFSRNCDITGNLGSSPEIRASKEGKQFITFTLAHNYGTKENPKTDWFECSAEGNVLDNLKKFELNKGTKIRVGGFFRSGAYLNKEGAAIATTRVYVRDFMIFDKKVNHDKSLTDTEVSVIENEISNTSDDTTPFN